MGGFIVPRTVIGGDVLLPGIPLQSNPLTGIYQDGANIGFSIGGVQAGSWGAAGFNIINGLFFNSDAVITQPDLNLALTPVYTTLAMVANAGSAQFPTTSYGDSLLVTGNLTAAGLISLFDEPARDGTTIINNQCTGNFPLSFTYAGGATYAIPKGISVWRFDGSAGGPLSGSFKLVSGPCANIMDKSAVAVVAPANVAENVLATINVPPMNANDQIRLNVLMSCNVNANAKNCRVRLGGIAGAVFKNVDMVNNASLGFIVHIANRGVTNSQVGPSTVAYGLSVNPPLTGAIDTSVATTIVITAQKAVAGDTMTLESYLFEIVDGNA